MAEIASLMFGKSEWKLKLFVKLFNDDEQK
jgi:hypothetical protein